jgi:hypothetical protein
MFLCVAQISRIARVLSTLFSFFLNISRRLQTPPANNTQRIDNKNIKRVTCPPNMERRGLCSLCDCVQVHPAPISVWLPGVTARLEAQGSRAPIGAEAGLPLRLNLSGIVLAQEYCLRLCVLALNLRSMNTGMQKRKELTLTPNSEGYPRFSLDHCRGPAAALPVPQARSLQEVRASGAGRGIAV